jgi:hypothetical protein
LIWNTDFANTFVKNRDFCIWNFEGPSVTKIKNIKQSTLTKPMLQTIINLISIKNNKANEKCRDKEEYIITGCKERRRLV